MHRSLPFFLLGYHGCRKGSAERILSTNNIDLRPSQNSYDWLGHGIYFWENSPTRALQFARERRSSTQSSKRDADEGPYVIGAVIDPGRDQRQLFFPLGDN